MLIVFKFISIVLLVLEMKVMVKEARRFSSDVEYPENTNEGNDGSAQVRLPQELFEKYQGREFFCFDYFQILMVAALKIGCSV